MSKFHNSKNSKNSENLQKNNVSNSSKSSSQQNMITITTTDNSKIFHCSVKANKSRTYLLLLLNSECQKRIREHTSMINNRTFAQAEKEFSQDNIVVHLKPEIYSPPSHIYGKGEGYLKKSFEKSKSPDCHELSPGAVYKKPIIQSFRKRETLGRKKIEHFRRTIIASIIQSDLKYMKSMSPKRCDSPNIWEEIHEVSSFDQRFLNKKMKVEQGLQYLHNLTSQFKNAKGRLLQRQELSEVKEMLYTKNSEDSPVRDDHVETRFIDSIESSDMLTIPALKKQKLITIPQIFIPQTLPNNCLSQRGNERKQSFRLTLNPVSGSKKEKSCKSHRGSILKAAKERKVYSKGKSPDRGDLSDSDPD